MKERRIGTFTVSDKLLHAAIDSGHGANLFAGSVPLDVRRDFIAQRTEFFVWNPAFRPITEGEVAPEYRAVFRDGETMPTWEEVRDAAERREG